MSDEIPIGDKRTPHFNDFIPNRLGFVGGKGKIGQLAWRSTSTINLGWSDLGPGRATGL